MYPGIHSLGWDPGQKRVSQVNIVKGPGVPQGKPSDLRTGWPDGVLSDPPADDVTQKTPSRHGTEIRDN